MFGQRAWHNRHATVGVITSGHYTFSTESEGCVVITTGQLRVKLPREEWRVMRKGENYVVSRDSSFDVGAYGDAASVCYYKEAR
ncbi:MAG TPA: pyrimidine/purine nucleoside phosphorylase [Pyrinomonadaceae bacterium]|nr:pyrimidine/purine nucleoside phosphorylase [Pyrinomonadaceae bacterium]